MLDSWGLLAQLLMEAEDSSLSLSWVDGILALFFIYGFISAHRLGFYGELPRCLAWVGSLVLGVRWYPYVASQFEQVAHASPQMSAFYGFGLIGVFFLSVGYVIGMTVSKLRKKAVEQGFDLWGGFVLGPVKAVAAYFWLAVALLLFPSVWIHNHLGTQAYTGTLVMKYVPDVQERVNADRGGRDAVDSSIDRNKRSSPDEAVEQETESEMAPPSEEETR